MKINGITQKVILYGAGGMAIEAYMLLKEESAIVCYADKDRNKHNSAIEMPDGNKLFVFPLQEALLKYPDASIFVTPKPPLKHDIINELMQYNKIDKKSILNYDPFSFMNFKPGPHLNIIPTKRRSCEWAESVISLLKNEVNLCCFGALIPGFQYHYDNIPNEIFLRQFEEFKMSLINSLNTDPPLRCKECYFMEYKKWGDMTRRFKSVYITAGLRCQFNCIYCPQTNHADITEKNYLRKITEIIHAFEINDYFDENTVFYITGGEITIIPSRNAIFDAISCHRCVFLTNAEFFSEEIADILYKGKSHIQVSLDSGTQETFALIKGKSCYDKVKETIKRYSEYGPVELKYIILPGVNTNAADIMGFVNYAIEVNAAIVLSSDMLQPQKFDQNIEPCLETIKMAVAAARKKNLQVINGVNPRGYVSKYKQLIDEIFS